MDPKIFSDGMGKNGARDNLLSNISLGRSARSTRALVGTLHYRCISEPFHVTKYENMMDYPIFWCMEKRQCFGLRKYKHVKHYKENVGILII